MFPNENNFETEFTFENELKTEIEESPFRILILGDWSGVSAKPEIGQRRLVEIDRDNFDQVISQYNVNLKFVSPDADTDDFSLSFEKLDDFHPDRLFYSVTLFEKLRDLRRRLQNPQEFNSAVREILTYSEPESVDSPAAQAEYENQLNDSANLLDEILSQKTVSDQRVFAETTDSKEFNSFLKDIIQPHLVKIDYKKQKELINVIDKSIGSLMRKILHYKAFQNLESAWRGLDFLVKNTETSSDLKIYIFDVCKTELAEHLKEYDNLFDSPFYKTIFQNDFTWAIINANFSFDLSVDDIALLIRLTKTSASNQAPLVSHLFLNAFDSSGSDNDFSNWTVLKNDSARKLWTTLRSQSESEYLGLLPTRFLARLPYGEDTEPLEEFEFEEFSFQAEDKKYLWANPCFVFSYLIAKTFYSFGWDISRNYYKETDLIPNFFYRLNDETVLQPPLENKFNLNETEKLLGLGLMPLITYKNSNIVRLVKLMSLSQEMDGLSGQWK